jgi:CRP-like cAMP-binding protein
VKDDNMGITDFGSPTPKQNHLLAALPEDDYQRLLPHLELVPMKLGESVYESGRPMQHVYFPTNSIVSLLSVTKNGATTETATVGNEGMVGVGVVMGDETVPSPALVRSSGYAYRLRDALIKNEFKHSESMQSMLLGYTRTLLAQMAQNAACNRHHSIEQQLCRCLLSSLDRLQTNEISMTQEFIAGLLGVRRESVTEAARRLQHAGLIQYSRGHITVTDRAGLEASVCECYSVLKKTFDTIRVDRIAA